MLRDASPYSLAITAALMSWRRERSLKACLAMDRVAARHMVTTPDFIDRAGWGSSVRPGLGAAGVGAGGSCAVATAGRTPMAAAVTE